MDIPDSFFCLTVDVEWAHDDVLEEMRLAFDERGLPATFFCTHANINVGDHERALHPNLRWSGDLMSAALERAANPSAAEDDAVREVVEQCKGFCPEAVGARGHYLRCDTALLGAYAEMGLLYDSSYLATLQPGVTPFRLPFGLIEAPIYYMDHLDLLSGLTQFRVADLCLGFSGMKVLDFHPNIVFTNAPDIAFYRGLSDVYTDPDGLSARRHSGRGARDLFLDLLDEIAGGDVPVLTLRDLASRLG